MYSTARQWWLTAMIIATQEAENRRITVRNQPQAKSSMRPYLKKPFTKIGLVEWPKVKALSSNPNTTHTKKHHIVQHKYKVVGLWQ
jgi:hypothetical protein